MQPLVNPTKYPSSASSPSYSPLSSIHFYEPVLNFHQSLCNPPHQTHLPFLCPLSLLILLSRLKLGVFDVIASLLPNYIIHHCDWKNHSGGILVYIKSTFSYELFLLLSILNFLKLRNHKITIGTFYCPLNRPSDVGLILNFISSLSPQQMLILSLS